MTLEEAHAHAEAIAAAFDAHYAMTTSLVQRRRLVRAARAAFVCGHPSVVSIPSLIDFLAARDELS